jgi:hypothetical protein
MFAEMFPWIHRRPAVIFIVIAMIFLGLGHFFKTHGVLGPLASFTAYLERSLESFDALRIGGTFYNELTGCQVDGSGIACAAGPDTTDRLQDTLEGRPQNGLIGSILAAAINTVASVFGQSTWLGILIYIVALVAAAVAITRVLDVEESGMVGIVLIVLLTPALASVAALGLKWLLLLFVILFSQVLAGIAWLLTPAGIFLKVFASGNEVLTTAHHIEELATGGEPPPGPQH